VASSSAITPRLLRQFPLPLETYRGKEGRGAVLAVGGSPGTPGAIMLAATAALRAGAGKLKIATSRSMSAHVAVAIPEALVVALAQTPRGGLARASARVILAGAAESDALVIGPGIADERGSVAAIRAVLSESDVAIVLDAGGLEVLKVDPNVLRGRRGRAVLTPHCGEMAGLLDGDRETIERTMPRVASQAARRYGAVVVLKDRDTHVATPDGQQFHLHAGPAGLATSGSGDVLAGVIGGLLARGCDPAQAAIWGVYAHAAAGRVLMRRIGVGFLAREILAEIPGVLRRVGT
jgi:ADP-dependent NAD(P)H-hydrate dehydratase